MDNSSCRIGHRAIGSCSHSNGTVSSLKSGWCVLAIGLNQQEEKVVLTVQSEFWGRFEPRWVWAKLQCSKREASRVDGKLWILPQAVMAKTRVLGSGRGGWCCVLNLCSAQKNKFDASVELVFFLWFINRLVDSELIALPNRWEYLRLNYCAEVMTYCAWPFYRF